MEQQATGLEGAQQFPSGTHVIRGTSMRKILICIGYLQRAPQQLLWVRGLFQGLHITKTLI